MAKKRKIDVKTYKKQLTELREEIETLSEVTEEARQPVELDQTMVGRLSRMDALQGQALAKAGKERAERQLKMIEAALMRIDNDEYGECMECGEPINPKRLEIDPTSLYCIDCAR